MARPIKRRRIQQPVEEVTFDPEAREQYLTGFRKRKQQRIKHAQEEAAKKERAFKIEHRKKMREQRDKDLKAHVEEVNALLKKAQDEAGRDSDEQSEASLDGQDAQTNEPASDEDVGHQDEYVDEDKYTTVTIEPMNMSGSGDEEERGSDQDVEGETQHDSKIHSSESQNAQKRSWTKENPNKNKPKKKRQKFRYESKVERKAQRAKQKSKNGAAARARKDAG